YHSPALAGFTVFAALAPGALVSPIAGALLDRHGRKWLIVLDQVVAAVALFLIGALALGNLLPPPLLLAIVLDQSVTFPLSPAAPSRSSCWAWSSQPRRSSCQASATPKPTSPPPVRWPPTPWPGSATS